jgi:cytoskeletal protein RodZ
MSTTRRTNQGGSIVTFIIVGVILAVGLIGGVYYLKQHGDQVRKEQAIAIANQQKKDNEEAAKSENTKKSSTTSSSSSATANTPSETTTSTNTSQNLPTTGPELAIGEVVGIYLLTASIVGYASSRHNLKRSL